MALLRNLLGTSPSGGDASNVEDVFSTYLYTSPNDSSTFSVNNGIDLDGEGGMVWLKSRNYNGGEHLVFDTERPNRYPLRTNGNLAEDTGFPQSNFTFSSTGFGITDGYGWDLSYGGKDYTSWTFRKAPRFFDVVTYTGNGVSGRTIAHDLGVVPGAIFVKATSASSDWCCMVRASSTTYASFLSLNTTGASAYTGVLGDPPTATEFTENSLGNSAGTYSPNVNGVEYVAYLFAHDPDGENGDDGMIACGSFNTDGLGASSTELGWEPQYVLVKRSDGAGRWVIGDTMRGMVFDSYVQMLVPNTSEAESGDYAPRIHATGFHGINDDANSTYIYMAIRAPMMVEPEAGTEVFKPFYYFSGNGNYGDKHLDSGFTTDMALNFYRTSTNNSKIVDRLRGYATGLTVNLTSTESTRPADYIPWTQTGQSITGNEWNKYAGNSGHYYGALLFKRAKGFFDVVAYTGNSSAGHTVNHSLGVAPEIMIVRGRNSSTGWYAYWQPLGNSAYIRLDDDEGVNNSKPNWYNTTPTATSFKLTGAGWNVNGNYNYIAYLFASLDGVSKVGSYTGNGSSQNIACGFSAGARFVLIKRTDGGTSAGDWYIWDTERGIITGNDAHKLINTSSPEGTSDDSIDPQSAGFTVNQVSATNINVSSGEYIFLAIA